MDAYRAGYRRPKDDEAEIAEAVAAMRGAGRRRFVRLSALFLGVAAAVVVYFFERWSNRAGDCRLPSSETLERDVDEGRTVPRHWRGERFPEERSAPTVTSAGPR